MAAGLTSERAAAQAALAAADGESRNSGAASDGSGSEASDDVVLEVNSWWLEHLTVRCQRCSSPSAQCAEAAILAAIAWLPRAAAIDHEGSS